MKTVNIASERVFLTTKNTFIISLIVMALTILGIWFFGIGKNRSLFENSILSTSILSLAFFLFLMINLYRGVKLKDNLGKISDKIDKKYMKDFAGMDISGDSIPDVGGDSVGGVILGIIAWILFSIILVFLLWLLGTLLWVVILLFASMLYWVFYRALRFAFKHSKECKDNLALSAGYAIVYTILYSSWIYGILFLSNYLLNQ
jgi:hypothetical protein